MGKEREEEEEERSDAKTSGKGGKKEAKKKITTPGVPRLSPTLVLTRPEEA